MKQWEIMGEMRRRIKIRLDAEGIEIPFPHQTIYWGEAQPPFRPDVAMTEAARAADEADVPTVAPTPVKVAQPIVPTDGSITPDQREELLAEIAMAAVARVGDADPDARMRAGLMDNTDGE